MLQAGRMATAFLRARGCRIVTGCADGEAWAAALQLQGGVGPRPRDGTTIEVFTCTGHARAAPREFVTLLTAAATRAGTAAHQQQQ